MEKEEAIWGVVQSYTIDPVTTPVAPLPKGFQQLVDQYVDLFAKPTAVPPKRSHTYTMPLLPGAQPYR
jgi:hypothetical protein